jgi:hypothetical protein
MTFVKRSLLFEIQLQGDTFDSGGNTLTLEGIRSRVTVQSWSGGNTAYGGHAVMQIWGMSPSDMAKISILGFDASRMGQNSITVLAGDDVTGNYSEVFSGNIFAAEIDYNSMPDVSITLTCSATLGQQVQPMPATSAPGSVNVATLLQSICAAANPPIQFTNNGVTAVLSNPAFAGSAKQQISQICIAAGIPYKMEPANTLTIWPRDKSVDGVTVQMDPAQGMVGYPRYSGLGLEVTMEFNPSLALGRQMTLSEPTSPSSGLPYPVPGMPGTFWINGIAHDLSAELPGGPWFSIASLSTTQIYAHS